MATLGTGTSARVHRPFEPLASLGIDGLSEIVVAEDGTTVYGAVGDGFVIVDVSEPSDPIRLAERRGLLAERDDGPLIAVQDIKIEDELAVLWGSTRLTRDPVVLGYDVSTPESPTQRFVHTPDDGIHNLSVEGSTLYLAGFNREMSTVVLDIEDDPTELARWSPVDHDDRWAEVPRGFRACHDVYAHGDRLYGCWWDAGTWILDVSEPAAPSLVSRCGGFPVARLDDMRQRDVDLAMELPGNSHNARPSPGGDLLAVGKEAFNTERTAGYGRPGGVVLWAIGDEHSPEYVTTLAPPAERSGGEAGVPTTTAHNLGWRGDRLYTSWYDGGVRVYDLSEPTTPRLLGAWRENGERFFAARPTAEAVVASDMGTGPVEDADTDGRSDAGLYVFSDPVGTASPAPTRDRVAPPTAASAAVGERPSEPAADDGSTD